MLHRHTTFTFAFWYFDGKQGRRKTKWTGHLNLAQYSHVKYCTFLLQFSHSKQNVNVHHSLFIQNRWWFLTVLQWNTKTSATFMCLCNSSPLTDRRAESRSVSKSVVSYSVTSFSDSEISLLLRSFLAFFAIFLILFSLLSLFRISFSTLLLLLSSSPSCLCLRSPSSLRSVVLSVRLPSSSSPDTADCSLPSSSISSPFPSSSSSVCRPKQCLSSPSETPKPLSSSKKASSSSSSPLLLFLFFDFFSFFFFFFAFFSFFWDSTVRQKVWGATSRDWDRFLVKNSVH